MDILLPSTFKPTTEHNTPRIFIFRHRLFGGACPLSIHIFSVSTYPTRRELRRLSLSSPDIFGITSWALQFGGLGGFGQNLVERRRKPGCDGVLILKYFRHHFPLAFARRVFTFASHYCRHRLSRPLSP